MVVVVLMRMLLTLQQQLGKVNEEILHFVQKRTGEPTSFLLNRKIED